MTEHAEDDERWMRYALRVARRARYSARPNPHVGCVLVRDGELVAEGWTQPVGQAHAEVHALERAGARARGATAYVTLEPCCYTGRTPPCTDRLIRARVSRVVAAIADPNPRVAGGGLDTLTTSGVSVQTGTLAEEAATEYAGFIRRMTAHRPLVRLKLAMSLDGRTAMASGESQWITGVTAREDVHRWRARSSAIVTGVDTALADDPALTARLPRTDDDEAVEPMHAQPLRVVLDSRLRLSPDAKMLREPGRTVVATTTATDSAAQVLERAGAEVVSLGREGQRVDLVETLIFLADQECNEVLFECGPRLAGSLVNAELVDELMVYMSPTLMGERARALMHLPDLDRIADRKRFKLIEVHTLGEDLRMRLSRT